MKTVGIIGGISPESTIDYYRSILAAYREQQPDGSAPSIIINSIDLKKLRQMTEADLRDDVVAYLTAELSRLSSAGADFAVISANTPHFVFDDLRRHSPLPLISIVEATREAAKKQRLTNLALLGTRVTMQGRFYPEVFSREHINLVVPEIGDQDYINDKYFGELVKGVFLPQTRRQLLTIIDRMQQRHRIEGVILAGTELPLLLRESPPGLPLLDTTQIHVQAIVKELLA